VFMGYLNKKVVRCLNIFVHYSLVFIKKLNATKLLGLKTGSLTLNFTIVGSGIVGLH
jgi:hypothetical protein